MGGARGCENVYCNPAGCFGGILQSGLVFTWQHLSRCTRSRPSSCQWKKRQKHIKVKKHRKELKNINVILYVITQVSALPQVSKNRRVCLFLNVTVENKEQEAQKGENSEVILNNFFFAEFDFSPVHPDAPLYIHYWPSLHISIHLRKTNLLQFGVSSTALLQKLRKDEGGRWKCQRPPVLYTSRGFNSVNRNGNYCRWKWVNPHGTLRELLCRSKINYFVNAIVFIERGIVVANIEVISLCLDPRLIYIGSRTMCNH